MRHRRHTFDSLLIQAGASLAYVRDQMGHSSIQVTIDIYGHLIPWENVSFVEKLNGVTCPQDSRKKGSGVNQTGLSECFRMNGWEAGIRTMIRRSRIYYRLLIPKGINNLVRQIAAESGKIRNAAARKTDSQGSPP